ncbi:4-hydroxybenzoate 3-monooxygenase [Saccharomonospora xinjiangensis]|uniref:4-hydroxybenzoate 3-monooxygenase n=1 Tax=Saccharomonospora xinjiangensis TaxID=75294 RepID=UPI00106FE6BF|nr:4-hydroxybenzoate 3-monooxygenase [Saccharomonospora xinjiangensis]QBQ62397.1 p-hydroxybenzoate hydroxylase [Saccharomonospora xinjiangensis]
MTTHTRDVEVGIVGAGPAGLMLSYLLHLQGVEAVVLEKHGRHHVEQRVRAGVCGQPTVDLLRDIGLGARLGLEGLPHHGFSLRFDRRDHRVPLTELTGKRITVYGQQEIAKDLIRAHAEKNLPIEFEVSDVALHDLDTERPCVTYVDADGDAVRLRCAAVAGCDGFDGVSRHSLPSGVLTVYEHEFPYAWLGVLAHTPPSHGELIYAAHERGFALHSMRSPELTRLYLQIDLDDRLEHWPDERVWEELQRRLDTVDGFRLREGPLLDKSITPMFCFVAEPMCHGRLFLAGDAAHIVPPTGPKGMNLAVADVRRLAHALHRLLRRCDPEPARTYSESCLRRVWCAQQFSCQMTAMLHRDPDADDFARRLTLAQLRHTVSSRSAAASFAEDYVGLPFE